MQVRHAISMQKTIAAIVFVVAATLGFSLLGTTGTTQTAEAVTLQYKNATVSGDMGNGFFGYVRYYASVRYAINPITHQVKPVSVYTKWIRLPFNKQNVNFRKLKVTVVVNDRRGVVPSTILPTFYVRYPGDSKGITRSFKNAAWRPQSSHPTAKIRVIADIYWHNDWAVNRTLRLGW